MKKPYWEKLTTIHNQQIIYQKKNNAKADAEKLAFENSGE